MAHILIIDDDQQIRVFLRKLLMSEGYTVTVAFDGSEGVECYKKNEIDLVITDLIMPEQEGLDTIEQLLTLNPDAKIIAMSGGGKIAPTNYLHTAKLLGAIATFHKPVSNEDLLKKIREIL